MPQLTDEQYNQLMADKRIADLVKPLWDDPSTSDEAKGLLKRRYPQLEIPEYDLKNQMRNEVAALRKERDDEKAAAKQREEEEGWKKQRAKAQADYGLTDDGMKEVEQFMVKNNVANYDIAASHLASKSPRASSPTAQHDSHYWNFGKNDKIKEISTDPEGYARNQFMQAIERDAARARQQQF